jgi:hypothetical protein
MTSAAEVKAAIAIADFHRQKAAKLPPESDLRALMLRCAGRWDRIGARTPQERLKVVS